MHSFYHILGLKQVLYCMFIVFSKKCVIYFIIFVLLLSMIFIIPSINVSSPKKEHSIVIDAGHGGIDVNIRHKVF